MAPYSSTLAWEIPWTEEPGGLQSMGSLRVGHDSSDLAAAAAGMCCVYVCYSLSMCECCVYVCVYQGVWGQGQRVPASSL